MDCPDGDGLRAIRALLKVGSPVEVAVDFRDVKVDYEGTKLGEIQKGNDIADQFFEMMATAYLPMGLDGPRPAEGYRRPEPGSGLCGQRERGLHLLESAIPNREHNGAKNPADHEKARHAASNDRTAMWHLLALLTLPGRAWPSREF